jgi:GNAT superfamily N-acetyltransferase
MLILEPPFPDSFQEIFEPHKHNLSSVSILRGLSKSKVYADLIDPTWAVTSFNSRILVIGDIDAPELLDAVQHVVDTGIASGRRGFVIYYPADTTTTELGKHIRGVTPYLNQRNYYALKLETKKDIVLPDGYRVERITPDFLRQGYENIELVSSEMMSERASVENFLEKSFGFCSLYGDTIASWCMSEYNVDQRFEIGIETHPDYRQKGLATQTATSCINYGLEKGYSVVGWHCWKRNIESNRLALKLGFRHVLEYPAEYLEVK